MCKILYFDTGNGVLDNDTAMDMIKSLLLLFLYLHTFISDLASATPKVSNKHLNNGKECACFEPNSHLKKIPLILDPKDKGIDRLVIFVYRIQNGPIYTYIPNVNKQALLPDLQYEYGDFLDINANEPVKTIFLNNIKMNKLGLFLEDSALLENSESVDTSSEDYVKEDNVMKSNKKRKSFSNIKKHRLLLKGRANPQNSESINSASKDSLQFDKKLKIKKNLFTNKQKPFKNVNKHREIWNNAEIPQDSQSISTPEQGFLKNYNMIKTKKNHKPFRNIKKNNLPWIDSTIAQDGESINFPLEDSLADDKIKKTKNNIIQKPIKNIKKHRLSWEDLIIPQDSESLHFPLEDSLESQKIEDSKKILITNTQKPFKHNKTNRFPWENSTIPQDRESLNFPSKDSLEGDKIKETKKLITNTQKPFKNTKQHRFPWKESANPQETVTPSEDSSEENKAKNSRQNLFPHDFTNKPKPIQNIMDERHQQNKPIKIFNSKIKPDKLLTFSKKTHFKGAKQPINYLETDSIRKIPPLIFFSEFDKAEKNHPELFDLNNINKLQYIPEVLDDEPYLINQNYMNMPNPIPPKALHYDNVKPKSILDITKKKENLFKNPHIIKSLKTPVLRNNLINKIFDKHRPMIPSKKESDLVNPFLIDEDMIGERWRVNSRGNFFPISSKRKLPGVSFDKWFITQMKNIDLGKSIKQPKDYKTLQHFVETALKRHGMIVSPKRDLRDSHGNSLNMTNVNLRRLLIGDSLEYYRVKENPNGTFSFPKNTSYMESLLIALLDPPKIIGIIPLGKINVPNSFDFNHVPKRNHIHHTTRKKIESDTGSVKNIGPEGILGDSRIDMNDAIINELKATNSNNEFRIGKPVNHLLNKSSKSKVSDVVPNLDIRHTVSDILNDSVPVSKSEHRNASRVSGRAEIGFSNVEKDIKKYGQDSSELPIQTIVSLLQSFVNKNKEKNTLSKENLLKALGISRRKKKLEEAVVKDSSFATVQTRRKYEKTLREESKANNSLAQYKETQNEEAVLNNTLAKQEKPRKEDAKSNKTLGQLLSPVIEKNSSHLPRELNSIVGGGETVDDANHDFRIIGGAAAIGSGFPISNRGRSADPFII